jgi:hypothetical protein
MTLHAYLILTPMDCNAFKMGLSSGSRPPNHMLASDMSGRWLVEAAKERGLMFEQHVTMDLCALM